MPYCDCCDHGSLCFGITLIVLSYFIFSRYNSETNQEVVRVVLQEIKNNSDHVNMTEAEGMFDSDLWD